MPAESYQRTLRNLLKRRNRRRRREIMARKSRKTCYSTRRHRRR